MRSEISQITSDVPLSLSIREYFQARLRQRLYDLVIKEFKSSGRTRAHLAKKLGKRPEQITRWLSGPGNLTLDTLSDLLLGLSGAELAMALEHPADQPRQPPRFPDALLRAQGRARGVRAYQAAFAVEAAHAERSAPTMAVALVTATLASSQSTHAGVL